MGISWLRTRRVRMWAFLALLITLVVVGSVSVRFYWRALADLHEHQALVITRSFASVVTPWLSLDRKQSLDVFADVLIETGCTGIQFVTAGGIAYERGDTAAWMTLPESEWIEQCTVRGGGLAGAASVEMVFPVTISEREPPFGYVRATFTASGLSSAVRARLAVMALTCLLLGVGLFATDWLLVRRERRAAAPEESSFCIDEASRHVIIRGHALELPPKQFTLLACLAAEPGRVFGDRELLESVWPESDYADSKDVKQCVYLLRRSLKCAVDRPEHVVRNIKGHGYRLDVSSV